MKFSQKYVFLTLIPVLQMSVSMLVQMNEPHIKVLDNGNISLTCRTEQPKNVSANLALSVRARMVLTFLKIPRGSQLHQVHGVLHCDPMRTKCESEFNIAVDCITARINISQPLDTLESACQLVDDQVCSHNWLRKHRYDCVALGTITVIKGPKLGESCVHLNQTTNLLESIPCGEHQYCDSEYGICLCIKNYIQTEKRKCVALYPDEELMPTPYSNAEDNQHPDTLSSTSSPTYQSTTIKTLVAGLPTLSSDDRDNTSTKNSNNRKTSKALVIFLLIVAILLCIALAVVIIWSFSRNRSLPVAANVSN